ncbi:MAG: biosynthetic arginine decarboxylase [Enterobacterales bacterium]|nr:biosynthetic arginine decarboxylase [Enterobacterales bacterium]
MTSENIQSARFAYSMDYWSAGYFDINSKGQVALTLPGDKGDVSLVDVVDSAQQQGLVLPLLVRFGSILQDRVAALCKAFDHAMSQHSYEANFTSVYPIKVNQQRRVVEEIISTPMEIPRCDVGLEAGSKPELMAVLALSEVGSTIVCNGYKDREYVRLALIGEKTQRKVYIVVEKLSELALVLNEAKALNVKPRIGIRARLSSIGKGNWQNTGGEKSKFGLSAAQVLQVVGELDANQQLDCLQLLHFHLGSQISNIRDIQKGMKEAARYFAELTLVGAAINVVDVGGGLGVDYEGTRTRSYCSVNYSMNEYASAIVLALKEACINCKLSAPNIITESGRAMTAHHAVLITNVIGQESVLGQAEPQAINNAPLVIEDLMRCYQSMVQEDSQQALTELYHEIAYRLSEAHDMYTHGALSLRLKALAEQIYYATCELMRIRLNPNNRTHLEILEELNEKLADKVFLNFSLFQSMPDVWGIDQVFPIMPIDKLDQPLTRRGVLQDITCDSDGRIDKYVDSGGLSTSLPLPEFSEHDQLKVAMFMVGAYQEILGDMHNLFGDTDAVDAYISREGELQLKHATKGDTVDGILEYVNFEPRILLQRLHQQLIQSQLPSDEQAQFLAELKEGLSGYTYLE